MTLSARLPSVWFRAGSHDAPVPQSVSACRRRYGGRQRREIGGMLRHAELQEPSALLLAGKRAVDVVGAGMGLLVMSPLLIGIAIAIKATSTGPVFFRQKRYGYHN